MDAEIGEPRQASMIAESWGNCTLVAFWWVVRWPYVTSLNPENSRSRSEYPWCSSEFRQTYVAVIIRRPYNCGVICTLVLTYWKSKLGRRTLNCRSRCCFQNKSNLGNVELGRSLTKSGFLFEEVLRFFLRVIHHREIHFKEMMRPLAAGTQTQSKERISLVAL